MPLYVGVCRVNVDPPYGLGLGSFPCFSKYSRQAAFTSSVSLLNFSFAISSRAAAYCSGIATIRLGLWRSAVRLFFPMWGIFASRWGVFKWLTGHVGNSRYMIRLFSACILCICGLIVEITKSRIG